MQVTLNPGESQIVSFEVTPTAAKTYSVKINGLVGSLIVESPPGEQVIWNFPIGGVAVLAPESEAGRPYLSVPVACTDIIVSGGAELWGIYYLVETGPDAGTWLWYIPGFISSTLTHLEPDKFYWVIVSAPCTLILPQ